MEWWQWMILGGLLLGAELAGIDAQFYLIFIGVSALMVGLAELVGINMPMWVQMAAFGVFSLVFLYLFRRKLYDKIRGAVEGFRETINGESVHVEEDIAAGAETRVEFRGSRWTTRNVGDGTITAGSRAKVVKVDGLTLHVEAE